MQEGKKEVTWTSETQAEVAGSEGRDKNTDT
jgi:hypothetical protein